MRWRHCGLFKPPSFTEFKVWRKLAAALIEKSFNPARYRLGLISFDGARQNRPNPCEESVRIIGGDRAIKFLLAGTLRRQLEIFLTTESVSCVRADDKLTAFLELKSAIHKTVFDIAVDPGNITLALSPLGVSPWSPPALFPQG